MAYIIDSRTREERLQDQINHAAHVCRKHINRNFAERNAFIMTYDNAERAYYYARLTFRRAAELNPDLRACSAC